MVLMFSATRNLYDKIPPLLESLFQNNPDVYRVYLFIEDDNFPYEVDPRVKTINATTLPQYIKPDTPNYNSTWTPMAFIRCYISKIIIEDKIIYADIDVIFSKNVRHLWDIDMEDCYVCAVPEKENTQTVNHSQVNDSYAKPYFNSGVLLMNLRKIREDGIDDLLIELLSTKKLKFPDQDALNIACKNKVKYIDSCFNHSRYTVDSSKKAVIIHTTPFKPWNTNCINNKTWNKYNAFTVKLEGGDS